MKKLFIFLVIMGSLLSVALVVSASNEVLDSDNGIPAETLPATDVEDNDKSILMNDKILSRQKASGEEASVEIFSAIVENLRMKTDESKKQLAIPVYAESELLVNTKGQYLLGSDGSIYQRLSIQPNSSDNLYAVYPTSAIRLRDSHSAYTIYATDTGYRLYHFFFEDVLHYGITAGFPVLIREMYSYDHFSELKAGDPIEKVETLDPIISQYKKCFQELWQLTPSLSAALTEAGRPCTSIHYLKDGILRIEYQMLDNGDLVISNMEYNEEYILTNLQGKKINYRIDPRDLP